MKFLSLLLFLFLPYFLCAQPDQSSVFGVESKDGEKKGFPFGKLSESELQMKIYDKDTSTTAVVLNEFGETRMNREENVEFYYHVRIKILKQEGYKWATRVVPLYLREISIETINEIQASTFNFENNIIKESKLDKKNVFKERTDKNWELVKFALPDVRVGSVIDIRYSIVSPFKFNWRTWEFQSDIPKVCSEFWAQIPGNYVYNITLKGLLKLDKNESKIVPKCFSPGVSVSADCALMKYGMKDIPAFKEEDYMTSKNNFISKIVFELSELKRFDGAVFKYTKEWKDVNAELQSDDKFGTQIKQARKVWDDEIELMVKGVEDPLKKAKLIFDRVKKFYLWNGNYGNFTELGAKKAFQERKGNIADINLSLIGALQSAGLQVDPALISTRSHGLPLMINPVITDFNYVVARLTINQDQFWLDATNPLYAFGFIPEHCLNGKARIIGKDSDWIDIKPKDKDKKITEVNLLVEKSGTLKGSLKIVHHGYDAFEQRKKHFSYSSSEEYWKAQAKNWNDFEVLNYSSHGIDSLEGPFTEEYEILFNQKAENDLLYFSPFLIERWEKNPFKSAERSYPVDFGAPLEETTILKLDYQNLYSVDELPKRSAAALPLSGGRYSFNVSNLNNAIQMTSSLTLNKSVYSSEEYHFLKELFARVIQAQESQFVLKRNK